MYNSKEKLLAFRRRNYKRKGAKAIEYQRDYRKKRRAIAVGMLGGKCAACGGTEDLHFDHIDPATKTAAISNLLGNWAKLQAELPKCQLLCAACHREKTSANHEYRPAAQHGSSAMYNDHKCRCNDCRKWKRDYTINWKDRRAGKLAAPARAERPQEA